MRKGREGREGRTLLELDPDSRPGQRTEEGTAGRQMTQAINPFEPLCLHLPVHLPWELVVEAA